MFKILTLLAFVITALTHLIGCGSDSNTEKVLITGSSTIAPLMSEIAKAYEASHSGVKIEVQSGGSSKGLNDVRQGIADIGMVSRRLKKSENDVNSITIAIDGLAIIVHKDNPLSFIKKQQVIDIYSGKINNWAELGGQDREITVVSKAEGRSTLEVFTKYFNITYRDIKANVIIGDNQQGIQTVNGNKGAIGYVSIGAAEYESINNNANIKLLTLDGVLASTENIKNNSYPIARDLNLVLKGNISETLKDFIEFTQSSKVDKIFISHSLIPMTNDEFDGQAK